MNLKQRIQGAVQQVHAPEDAAERLRQTLAQETPDVRQSGHTIQRKGQKRLNITSYAACAAAVMLVCASGAWIWSTVRTNRNPVQPGTEVRTEPTQTQTETELLPEATVPDLVGFYVEYAGKVLDQEGIAYSVYYNQSSTYAEGLVMRMDPKPGSTVAPGDQVHLYVSEGVPEYDVMADCTGLTAVKAKVLLEYNGMQVETETVDSDAPAGTVIGQSIEPGANALKGDTVTLTIAMSETFPMPDFTELDYENAKWLLSLYELDFSLNGEHSDQPRDMVYYQSIPAGETVSKHTDVTLRFSQGQPVTVPDCTALSAEQACRILADLGMTCTLIKAPSDQPPMTVIAQDLTAGELVEPETEITLTIADGDISLMPDLIGMRRDDAVHILLLYGVDFFMRSEESDQPEETIIWQSVAPGEEIPANKNIQLTFSHTDTTIPPDLS
jgi:beta-lactam-binding protein with PASTA domain